MSKPKIGWIVLAALLFAFVLAGCGGPKQNGAGGTDAAKQEMTVKAYYADESLDKLNEREISIRFASDDEKYRAALTALATAPDARLKPLAAGLDIRSVKSENGNVVIDLSVKDEGRLGSPGEMLLIEAIRKTMFQFPEVKTFDLLVDGKPAESLMGHVDLQHPFKRDS